MLPKTPIDAGDGDRILGKKSKRARYEAYEAEWRRL